MAWASGCGAVCVDGLFDERKIPYRHHDDQGTRLIDGSVAVGILHPHGRLGALLSDADGYRGRCDGYGWTFRL